MNEHLEKYYNNGFNYVEGWVEPKLFYMVDFLNSININKKGGIAEIGIHHGRFYLLLNQLTDATDQSYAIDIFDNQHLNVDQSGSGSLHAFINNLTNYDKHGGKNTQIIVGDSTDSSLDLNNVIKKASIRFFSIDGGHTPQHTLNDLKIAEQAITNEGIVIVDDILHPCWLGVLEGTLKFLDAFPNLVPFALGDNKLFMCKLTYKNVYIQHMKNYQFRNVCNTLKFFGHDIIAFDV